MLNKMIISLTFLQFQFGSVQAQPTWVVDLNLQAGNTNLTLSFGGDVNGTSGFDIGLDVPAPPPPFSYYAYFQISGSIITNLNTDIRAWISPFINSIDWTLVVTNANGIETTISWDPAELPSQGILFLESANIVNMKNDSSTTFSGNQIVTIHYSKPPLKFRVERTTGNVFAQGAFKAEGADLSEYIDVSEPVAPGDVVELDPNEPGYYQKARGQNQLVVGVIATKPGFLLGNIISELDTCGVKAGEKRPTLVLMGRVPVKANIENGSIQPGDLLTVSSKPGFAMRCDKPTECKGAIIGKALQSLETGEGKILVLVMAR